MTPHVLAARCMRHETWRTHLIKLSYDLVLDLSLTTTDIYDIHYDIHACRLVWGKHWKLRGDLRILSQFSNENKKYMVVSFKINFVSLSYMVLGYLTLVSALFSPYLVSANPCILT